MAERVFPKTKKQITPLLEARWRSRGYEDKATKGKVQPSPALSVRYAYLSLAEVKNVR